VVAAFVVIEAGELIAFQAARTLEGDAVGSSQPEAARSCGNVKAGTDFFPRPQFAVEKPGGDQRQGLMVIPATPGADLVVRQPNFALAALQALFDPMPRLGDAGQFAAWRVGGGFAATVYKDSYLVSLPGHEQAVSLIGLKDRDVHAAILLRPLTSFASVKHAAG
jgi:hypothetical protein